MSLLSTMSSCEKGRFINVSYSDRISTLALAVWHFAVSTFRKRFISMSVWRTYISYLEFSSQPWLPSGSFLVVTGFIFSYKHQQQQKKTTTTVFLPTTKGNFVHYESLPWQPRTPFLFKLCNWTAVDTWQLTKLNWNGRGERAITNGRISTSVPQEATVGSESRTCLPLLGTN